MTFGVVCVAGDGAGWGLFGVAIGTEGFCCGSILEGILTGVGSALMIGCVGGVLILNCPCLIWVFGLGLMGIGAGAT